MPISTTTYRATNTRRSNALWFLVAVALVVADGSSAFADLMFLGKPSAQEQLILSLDNGCIPLDLSQTTASPFYRIGYDEWYEVGAGGRNAAKRPHQQAPPAEPLELFLAPAAPLVGLSQSSGAGSTPSDSSGGIAAAPKNLVLGWILHFSLQPTRSGWLTVIEVFNIPTAPPFELLRPPQQLTALA